MAHCHPAEREQQAPLVFGRQRLPNRVERTFGHRAIQASAPRRTTPGSQSAADRRVASNYQRCLVWDIEQVFRALKSDCLRIEDSQLPNPHRLAKLALIALIAATEAMQLVLARDGTTGQPLSDAVAPTLIEPLRRINASLEGVTALSRNTHPETSLAWLAWIVARLGGWSGYTSRGYRPPGPKTMHHGLLRLRPMIEGWGMRDRFGDMGLR